MTPGVYQVNFRGLTIREAWRFGGGPIRFVLALVLKTAARKAGRLWLPAHECEEPCSEADLSPEARQELLPVVTEARGLGYSEGRFCRMARILDPHMQQGFSYLALHRDRQRGLFIGFVVNNATGSTRHVTVLSAALVGADGTNHEFVNHRQHFDNGGLTRKHQLRSRTVTEFDAALQLFMAAARDTFRSFENVAELKAYLRSVEDRSFEARIARGLLCYIGKGTPPPLPGGG
jgi:hypothetical protein